MLSRLRRLGCWGAITAIALLPACSSEKPDKFEVRRETQRLSATVIAEAAREAEQNLNAVKNWTGIDWKFTANVRSALVRSDGRPMFFTGRLSDVDFSGEAHYITVDVNAWVPFAMRFRLNCDPGTTQLLLEKQPGQPVVGVAVLRDVRLTREGSPFAAGLERQYLATGRCLYVKALQ